MYRMKRKVWYKECWDKDIFKQGSEMRSMGGDESFNPYDEHKEPVEYALWLMGWAYESPTATG